MSRLKKLFRLLLASFLILLGVGIILNPEPMPGGLNEYKLIIGLILIGIGGAINKSIDVQATERYRRRA